MVKILIVLLMTAAGLGTQAQDNSVEAARSPGDMSVDERREMMGVANTYNTCVYEQALANINADDDIRRIADIAMGACQGHLETLAVKITAWGFPQGFADRFTGNVRNRAARKLLAELAVRKS